MPSDTTLAFVRKTQGQTLATDGLIEYLRSLPSRSLTSAELVPSAERLWFLLRDSVGVIAPPAASPLEEGGIRFSWTAPGRFLEIEINAERDIEWFYRDTPGELTDFGQSVVEGALANELIQRLRDMFQADG